MTDSPNRQFSSPDVPALRRLLERCSWPAATLTDDEVVTRTAQICAAVIALGHELAGSTDSAPREHSSIFEALTRVARRDAAAAVLDRHLRHEFVDHDVDATMKTMVAEPHVTHVPTMTGGVGRQEVRRFYRDHFISKWPADTRVTPVSRTIGTDQVIDELVLHFTHDVEMDAVLPGVPPTGRAVELPHVVIAGIRDGKIAHEHIYWDQATVLVQVGLLARGDLPVCGAEQARKVLDPSQPSNMLITGWRCKPES
jgi:carboxymethylenebutenolidase